MHAAIFLFSLLLVLANALALGAEHQKQQSVDCRSHDEVSYGPPKAVPINDRILIHRTEEQFEKIPTSSTNEKLSEQGTARLVFLKEPDFMKNGPWSTKVPVSGNEARPIRFTIEVRDHANNPVRFQWMNEKLLFIRVWWGRIVSTDLVLDVDAMKPIYLAEANYYRLIIPCEEKRENRKE